MNDAAPWSLEVTIRRSLAVAEADHEATPARLLRSKRHAVLLLDALVALLPQVPVAASGMELQEGSRLLAENYRATDEDTNVPAAEREAYAARAAMWEQVRTGCDRPCPTCGRPGVEDAADGCDAAAHPHPDAAGVVRLFAAISHCLADALSSAARTRSPQGAFLLDAATWAARECAQLAHALLPPAAPSMAGG